MLFALQRKEGHLRLLKTFKPSQRETITILFIGNIGADIPGIFSALQSALLDRLIPKGGFCGNMDELTVCDCCLYILERIIYTE